MNNLQILIDSLWIIIANLQIIIDNLWILIGNL